MITLAPVIQNPKDSWAYRRYLKEKQRIIESNEKLKEREEEEKRMKEELSKEEFARWKGNRYYKEHKKEIREAYEKRALLKKQAELEEYEELAKDYPPIKTDREKEIDLLNKYREDYTDGNGEFKMYRWCTRLRSLNFSAQTALRKPIKIIPTPWVEKSIRYRLEQQHKVYEYIKPHIDKVKAEDIIINGKQIMHNKLQYSFREGSFIAELAKEKKVNKNTLAQISRAMIDWKYIDSECFLWPVTYLCGDRIYTSMGATFPISPYNNYAYLTEDNFDQVHLDTQAYLKRKDKRCAIAIGWYCYLIKVPNDVIQNEEKEKEVLRYDYYIVPYKPTAHSRSFEWTYDLFYKEH